MLLLLSLVVAVSQSSAFHATTNIAPKYCPKTCIKMNAEMSEKRHILLSSSGYDVTPMTAEAIQRIRDIDECDLIDSWTR